MAARSWWRRRWRWAAALVGLIAVFGAFFGCTSTVTPPREPANPTEVFLLRESMHVGVVLPATSPGRYVEFGFGDWHWYALGEDQWYNVFRTVLWPTPGTLCRREFVAGNADDLRRAAYWAELSPLVVGGAEVAALRGRLEVIFRGRAAHAVERKELGFTFVPSDESYWFMCMCADVAAGWFRELGCSVSWVPIRSSLRVAGS